MMTINFHNAQQLELWIIDWMKSEMNIAAADINPETPLANYEISSIEAALLISDFNQMVDKEIDPTIVWDALNIRELADNLVGMLKPLN